MANGSGEDPVVGAPAAKATQYGVIAASQPAARALFSVPPVVVEAAVIIAETAKFLDSIETASPATPWVIAARQNWKVLQAQDPGLPNVVIADLHWYSTNGYRATKKAAVRDLWAAGFDAWTNSSSLVLVSKKLGDKYDTAPQVAEILLKHEAEHVAEFLQYGRPSTYLKMAKLEARAYANTRDELDAAGFYDAGEAIGKAVTFFEGRLARTAEPDSNHRDAMIAEGYLPASAGASTSSLYIP